MDESAYLSQSFFADLWIGGEWDDPAWLTYAGYDLPPLPKYLIGLSLRVQGFRRPVPATMWAWYADTSRQFVSRPALVAARRPSVLMGAVGCLAIYALGTLARDRRVGLLSALLLLANPLYAMHARRAMSDVPAEALILSTTAVGLWAWKRRLAGRGGAIPALTMAGGAGLLGGLATLAKLNGVLGDLILGSWAVLAMLLPSALRRATPARRAAAAIVSATIVAVAVSFATFAALNPFLFARPKPPVDPRLEPIARLGFVERARVVRDHRMEVSDRAKALFPKDALMTPAEQVGAVLVQGFGRFGPLGPRGRTDSTVRFSWGQDRGAGAWLPIVALGLVAAIARGRAQLRAGEPPAAWAIAVQAGVAFATVAAFIPLAWDRYFLSIQPGSALLGAFAAVEGLDLARGLSARKSPQESPL